MNEDTKIIFEALGNNSDSVRFIGGCVRDNLIGKKYKDIDIATIFTPNEVIEKLSNYNIKTIPVGIEFGTIGALINGVLYEITTLRKDISCDGRHAQVEFTDDWELDSTRRDFTINALSCSGDGEIFDYHNGINDLNNNIVKFIGDAGRRIEEDYLRILRFFRFSSYYANNLNEEALNAIKNLHHNIDQISGERIQAEMFKIITSPKSTFMFESMQNILMLNSIGIDNDIDLSFFKNLIEAEKLLGQNQNVPRGTFSLSCKNLEKITNRWKLPNKIKSELNFFKNNIIENNISIKVIKDKAIEFGKESAIDILILSLAKNLNSHEFYKNALVMIENFEIPVFPLTGQDLIKLGVKPGKNLGELLSKARAYWIDNDYLPDKDHLVTILV